MSTALARAPEQKVTVGLRLITERPTSGGPVAVEIKLRNASFKPLGLNDFGDRQAYWGVFYLRFLLGTGKPGAISWHELAIDSTRTPIDDLPPPENATGPWRLLVPPHRGGGSPSRTSSTWCQARSGRRR
jgi:hypothetical protein